MSKGRTIWYLGGERIFEKNVCFLKVEKKNCLSSNVFEKKMFDLKFVEKNLFPVNFGKKWGSEKMRLAYVPLYFYDFIRHKKKHFNLKYRIFGYFGQFSHPPSHLLVKRESMRSPVLFHIGQKSHLLSDTWVILKLFLRAIFIEDELTERCLSVPRMRTEIKKFCSL